MRPAIRSLLARRHSGYGPPTNQPMRIVVMEAPAFLGRPEHSGLTSVLSNSLVNDLPLYFYVTQGIGVTEQECPDCLGVERLPSPWPIPA